jgi:Domain of unknown function (DUF397)
MSISDLEWRASRRSGAHSHCVQIAVGDVGVRDDRLLLMRDSKDTAGPVLAITPAEWKLFTRRIKGSLLSL